MSEIDYALAWDFISDDGRPYQLRFRCENPLSDHGQLIAVIAKPNRPDKGHTIAISRPGRQLPRRRSRSHRLAGLGPHHRNHRQPRRHPPPHPTQGSGLTRPTHHHSQKEHP